VHWSVEWLWANSQLVGGAIICYFTSYVLAAVDFVMKAAADEFSNYKNPFYQLKSMVWFATIGAVCTLVYFASIDNRHAFFETISWGFSNLPVRGFAIGCTVTAILKSTFTTFRESQIGLEGLYAFVQGRVIAACRRDSGFYCWKLRERYKGKFRNDEGFLDFMDPIVDSEFRALTYSDARKKQLRDQYDSVRDLLRTADQATLGLDRRSEIYDSLVKVALDFCPIRHIERSLKSRDALINRTPTRWERLRTSLVGK
jgi:hypothetical protein